MAKCVQDHEKECLNKIGLEEISTKPMKTKELKTKVQDPLIEVNPSIEEKPRVTFVSGHLGQRNIKEW